MNLQGQTALLTAILTLAAGFAVILRRQRPKAWFSFSLLNFNLFSWQLGVFMRGVSDWGWWPRISLAAAALIPAAGMMFFQALFEPKGKLSGRLAAVITIVAGVLALVAFSPFGSKKEYAVAVGLFVFPSLYVCTGLAWRARRVASSKLNRTRLLYLFGGGLVVVSLNLLDVLARAGIMVPPLGNIAVLIYIYFLSQMIFKYRLVDVQDLIAKGLVAGLLALLLTAIFSILTVWVEGDRPGLFFFNALVASVVILLLFDPMKSLVEDKARKVFFPRSKELTRLSSNLEGRLARALEPGEIASLLVQGLSRLKRVVAVSVYFSDQDGLVLERTAYYGKRPAKRIDLEHHKALAVELQSGTKYLLREALREELQGELQGDKEAQNRGNGRCERLLQSMEHLKAGVCIPLKTGDVVMGLLNLDDEAPQEAYLGEELAGLKNLADRAAVAYEMTRLFQAREERARLASLGEMAASLAHEIRNPLGAIKGAAQFLGRSAEGKQGEFLDIILEETNRLNGVVEHFLEYARPYRLKKTLVDVNELVKHAVSVIRTDTYKNMGIEFRPDPDLPSIIADHDGLQQVLLNLLRNAFEAMDSNGEIMIYTARSRRISSSLIKAILPGKEGTGWIEIRIRDNGPGVPAALREKIFSPFYTTKERGTGLGLAISRRIVEAHGGRLLLKSRHGSSGATFYIRLPVDAGHGHDMLAGKDNDTEEV
ncbi:MAG: hypothetical protein GXP49_11405 [Deltaproteobacteria bacterium]|nr:hypothetical protein [Deltaproteobacteria bacterium]